MWFGVGTFVTEGVALRTALFWVVTQRIALIPYRRFGTNYRSHLQGYFWALKVGLMGSSETSVRNYRYSLGNNPEEHNLNEVTPLCTASIYSLYQYTYFRQHNYIMKAWVKANATCFDLNSHPQVQLRTMKFFTVWLRTLGIPNGSQFLSTGKLINRRTNTNTTNITTRNPISEQRPQEIAHVTYLTLI